LLGKIVGWLVGIFVVIWIVTAPAGAGDDVHSWVMGAVAFFQHLARG
jgi:hypothetical protein